MAEDGEGLGIEIPTNLSNRAIEQQAKATMVEPDMVIEKPKVYSPQTASFKELMEKAVLDADLEVRSDALEEAKKRVEEVCEIKQLVHRGELKTSMVDTLQTSTWDESDKKNYFYTNMIKEGRTVEREMQGIEAYNTPRYRGMMEQMYASVANHVSSYFIYLIL